MKKIILSLMALTFLLFQTTHTEAQTKAVKNSKVTWKGYKVGGEHTGTIKLESGKVVVRDGKITGGTFVIDMKTISATDLSGGMKKKLDKHLASKDFFSVEEYPTAKLVITKFNKLSATEYSYTADVTIHGITKSETFNATVKDNQVSAKLKIDRSKFDVKYGSTSFFEGLKDKAIYDEFDLNISFQY